MIETFIKSGKIKTYLRSDSIEFSTRVGQIKTFLNSSDSGGITAPVHAPSILMESLGYILMETGDTILLE